MIDVCDCESLVYFIFEINFERTYIRINFERTNKKYHSFWTNERTFELLLFVDSTEIDAHMNTNVANSIELNAEMQQKLAQSIETNENSNSIEAKAGYIESSSDIKHNEPKFEMLDTEHNKSSLIGGGMQRNMQRILVNVSIGTDSGEGTRTHGVYMLHVSVPAGQNLMPSSFEWVSKLRWPILFWSPISRNESAHYGSMLLKTQNFVRIVSAVFMLDAKDLTKNHYF